MADAPGERSALMAAPHHSEPVEVLPVQVLPAPATRVFMIFVATFISLMTAGIIFGYAAIKPVFVAEGAYGYLCPPSNTTEPSLEGCTEQKLQLDLMFTVASFAVNLAAFPTGVFLDRAGPKVTTSIGSVLHLIGLVCLGFSNDKFQGYIPGYTLIALGGTAMFMSYINFMNLFPAYMGTINGVLTGAFDTSSLIFMLFKVAYFQLHISLKQMWLLYIAIPVINFVFAMFFLSNKMFVSQPSEEDDDKEPEEPLIYNIHDMPSRQQLTSPEYILVGLFVAVFMLRLNFYIATIGEQLVELVPPDQVNWLNDVFNVVLPVGGIVTIPLVGTILDKHGPITMFFFLAIMLVIHGVLNLAPSWWLQIINFWVFVIARTCLYAAVADFSGRMFGFKSFGTVYGLLMMIAAFANLLQYPLDNLANEMFHHSFFWVNVGLIVVSLLNFPLPIYLLREQRKRYQRGYQSIE